MGVEQTKFHLNPGKTVNVSTRKLVSFNLNCVVLRGNDAPAGDGASTSKKKKKSALFPQFRNSVPCMYVPWTWDPRIPVLL